MRVLLSGGGTAGHIYPALTVAERLRADGHEVAFAGTPNGPEARLAGDAGLAFHPVAARGFDRSRPTTLVAAGAVLAVSAIRAWRLLRDLKPEVVAGFGGYVSLPVGIAARMRRVPLVLHEQNSVPGIANRVLSRWACAIGITYRESAGHLRPGKRVEVTGNPVRESVLDATRGGGRSALGIPDDAVALLAFGGSRGARHINEALVRASEQLLRDSRVHVLHVAGREEAASVREALAHAAGDNGDGRYRVLDYVDDMGSAIAAADVIVARAGATSIAEITAVGRAAILVPYPHATDDHQTLNARTVAEGGGAVVVADDELDAEDFVEAIESLIADEELRTRMAEASRALGVPDATDRLGRLILECGQDSQDRTVA